ncbi:MAG TPA: HAD-IC family P-type ATPase [Armatimonadota bacterium]|nr:HAD-IC family P-type ATPase [Armatimonadota bacterium]
MADPGDAPQSIPWHAIPISEVFHRLETSVEGLSQGKASERLRAYGTNELQTAPGPSLGSLVAKQLVNPLIFMLLAAAVVSLLTGSRINAWIILVVVVLNTIVGVIQEWRAEQALDALKRLASPRARLLRDGRVEVKLANEVVPGDIVLLESGDRVAADVRLLDISELHVDESALTGESRPVEKSLGEYPVRTALADRDNMAWMSTAVTGGKARGVVVATGMQTVLGEIASEVRSTKREATPLQRRIAHLGTTLGIVAVVLSILIFVIGEIRNFPLLEMLIFAVAAAVSAIPEGLPAVISVVLALGVQRMAARHAIIRRLPAVETLGSTTVICTDKTGTITRNEMTVTRIWAGGSIFRITGEGFAPEGDIIADDGRTITSFPDSGQPSLDALVTLGSIANDATLEYSNKGWTIEGDPTEGALLVVARKAGLNPEALQEEYPRIDEIPFSSKCKYMATLHRPVGDEGTVLFVKGAPDVVLNFCRDVLVNGRRVPLTDDLREELLAVNTQFAHDALRVLAGAYREMPGTTVDIGHDDAERDLILLGFWGMVDPPRPESVHAIHAAKDAGIHVKMITGDHAVTAHAIAGQVGIVQGNEETVTGEELEEMSDGELRRRVRNIAVFARVSPSHKIRIVNALEENGELAAMTGDGVNDAPALKRASIGIAMGITGTEVAKEAADMVLTDDNFATIVSAIEEGRVIFNNLRKVVFFLVTTNLGEIITLAAALFLGLPLPLTAVMILWVNLVTDGVCTTPLGIEPKHWDVLKERPRDPNEGIINRAMTRRIAILSPLMAIGTLGLFWYELRTSSYVHAQTIAFTTLVAFQWFHAFNARSHRSSLFTIGIFRNRWLIVGIVVAVALQLLVIYWPPAEVAFKTTELSAKDWGYILLVASSIFWVDEVLKLFHVHRS